jgi:hypothetical protein
VNIVIVPPCVVPPVAGEATSSIDSMCTPTEITLNLVGNSTGAGQTYQWESSYDNVNWDPLTGAIGTNVHYNTDGYYVVPCRSNMQRKYRLL